MVKQKFYVYVLKTEDGQVFYVGKGSGPRMFWHRKVLNKPFTKEYQRSVYKRMRSFLDGRSFIEEMVFETDDEIQALLHEQARIRHLGFENLVNTQSHAFTGRKLKPEVGALIGIKKKIYAQRCWAKYGRGCPPEVAAKISASNKGRIVSQKTRRKLSASISSTYGGHFTDKHRAKLVDAKSGCKQTAAHVEARMRSMRGIKRSARHVSQMLLSRKQCAYALLSPSGEGFYSLSNGLTKLLKHLSLPTTSFYRKLDKGKTRTGWQFWSYPVESNHCAMAL
jgi:hypothetical protein